MLSLRKLFVSVLLVILFVTPVFGVSDQLNPSLTRLWDADGRYTCTASYIQPPINDAMSWVVTAGHCLVLGHGIYVKRNVTDYVSGKVDWRGMIFTNPRFGGEYNDLAIGTVPDPREGFTAQPKLWLAEKMPDSGNVWIHGFPMGVERITVGEVIPADVAGTNWPGSKLILVRKGQVEPGSSGSPVLNESGNLVGILWGAAVGKVSEVVEGFMDDDSYMIVIVTPVEKLQELLKQLKVSERRESNA